MTQEEQDVDRLIAALCRAFGDNPPSRTFGGGWPAPAMNVLDCVLSLNRRYYAFCEPRLDRFEKAHPEVQTLAQLLQLIGKYSTPLEFSITELDYHDEKRAATLVGVTTYLNHAQDEFDGQTEALRLEQWAASVTPEDYETPRVRGFALAGFQYLRMLFGAQTAKPDVHIRRFVSEAVGRTVVDAQALTLLEIAAKRLGWPLLELDNELWELRAQSGKLI